MRSTRIWLAALAVLAALASPAAARSNTVTDWNEIATTAIIPTAAQPPQAAILSLGMVQGAVYDAVNAIERSHRPYLAAPPAKRWASQDAAAATAAFRVLVALFPAQAATLQPQYDASLASVPDGRARAAGVAVGEAAASAMLAARQGDGRGGPFTFVLGTTPGVWRPTPPTFALDPVPWVGERAPVPGAERRDAADEGPGRADQPGLCKGTSPRSRRSAPSRARRVRPTRRRPPSSGRTTGSRSGTASCVRWQGTGTWTARRAPVSTP